MNKLCPLCKNEFVEIESGNNPRVSYFCDSCKRNGQSQFYCSYLKESDKLSYYNLRIDNYMVENIYKFAGGGRTDISATTDGGASYGRIIKLPLIKFDLNDLDKIKKKLKLILVMM